MNAQVLHGASYSGRCTGADPDNVLAKSALWPGYAGFGKYVSNNWNRTPDENHAKRMYMRCHFADEPCLSGNTPGLICVFSDRLMKIPDLGRITTFMTMTGF